MKLSLNLIFLIATAITAKAQNQANMTIHQDAPVVQSNEIIINASPEKVWQILTDINNWNEWNERITKPTSKGDLQVGSTFTWKTNGSKIKSRIHTLSPLKILGWEGKTFGARAIHNWYLESTASGTLVRVEESMDGWVIKLMKKKMNEKLADDIQYWLEQLKIESEK